MLKATTTLEQAVRYANKAEMSLPTTPTEGLVIRGNFGFPCWGSGWHQDGDVLRSSTGQWVLASEVTEFIPCRVVLPEAWDEMNAAILDDIGNETWSPSALMDTIEEVIMSNQMARKELELIVEESEA